jgi:hypothetical protein
MEVLVLQLSKELMQIQRELYQVNFLDVVVEIVQALVLEEMVQEVVEMVVEVEE